MGGTIKFLFLAKLLLITLVFLSLKMCLFELKIPSSLQKIFWDRKKILENAFCLDLKDSEPKNWLLVEDIITTGATLDFCGRLILENPKNELSIAAIGFRI